MAQPVLISMCHTEVLAAAWHASLTLFAQQPPGHSHCVTRCLPKPTPSAQCAIPGCPPPLIVSLSMQPQLEAGAGFTGRDAESGMVLLDRRRWLKVLYLTFYINTYHKQLYYRVVHGDKVSAMDHLGSQC